MKSIHLKVADGYEDREGIFHPSSPPRTVRIVVTDDLIADRSAFEQYLDAQLAKFKRRCMAQGDAEE